MVQYRLWLHHREVDQHLRGQQLTYKKELTEIDEHIASIEKMAMQADNALLKALIQQLNSHDHTTETKRRQIALNGTIQAEQNNQKHPAPPALHYGQQVWDEPQPVHDPKQQPPHDPKAQPLHSSPASSIWGEVPNFATQETHTAEQEILSLDTISVLPEATDSPLSSAPNSDHEPEQNETDLLPWWLRHLMQATPEEQDLPQTAPIDQQSTNTNERVERWFTRRTKLVHYDEWQESQKQ